MEQGRVHRGLRRCRGRRALALEGGWSRPGDSPWLVAQVSLQGRLRALEAELSFLRRRHRFEERFRLPVGGSREMLGGKVPLALVGLEGAG